VSDDYEGMLREQNRLLEAMAQLRRTGAGSIATASVRNRLKERAEFNLMTRDAMESALRRWAEGGGADDAPRGPRSCGSGFDEPPIPGSSPRAS
jgi:hypothetical protein